MIIIVIINSHPPLEVKKAKPWNVVADVEHAVEKKKLVQHLFELLRRNAGRRPLLLVQVPLPQHHPAYHVEAHRREQVLDAHAGAGEAGEAVEERRCLLHSNVLVLIEPAGGEELRRAHLAGLAPVGPVGGPGDVGVVVGGVLAGCGLGAGGEAEVHGLEDLLGGVDGGAYDDGDGAEAEMHDGAVAAGEFVDGAVGEGAHQVEVADDRPTGGTGGEVELLAAGAAAEGVEQDGEGGDEEGKVDCPV